MSPAQKFKFYFPAWTACVAANGWRTAHKTVVLDEARLTDEGRKVVTFARQRASARTRLLTLDDLRHGAHVLALGRDKSSADLANHEVDRIVTLFQLLADPDNLDARLKWDAYQRGEDPGALRRVEWMIRSVPEALARSIAQDMIGTRNWERASAEEKRVLARRIGQWKRSKQNGRAKLPLRRQSSSSALPEMANATDPDWNV